MLGIPLFFYDCYSKKTLDYLKEASECIYEIQTVLPNHCIIQEFQDVFVHMTANPSPVISENLMKEYAKNIQKIAIVIELWDSLKSELLFFENKKSGKKNLYNFYKERFRKKQHLIFSTCFSNVVDDTFNSLIIREMKQEISILQKLGRKKKHKFILTLPKIEEEIL
jgi:hypothetical protein